MTDRSLSSFLPQEKNVIRFFFFFLVKTWGPGMEKGTRQMEFIQKVGAKQRQGLGIDGIIPKCRVQRYQSLGKLPKATESKGGG